MIEPNFFGVLSLFVFHSISLYILFPSRCSRAKTAVVLFGMFLLSFAICWMTVRLSTSFFCLGFSLVLTVLIAIATIRFLSVYDISKTLFLFLLYAQAFIISMTLSAFISQRFFGGSSPSVLFTRTVLHIGIIILCAVLRGKFRLLVQGVIHGWWPLDFVEVLCFAYTSFFVLRIFDEPYGKSELISFLLFLMIIIAVYVVFYHTIRYMYLAGEQEKYELQSRYLLEQMKAMQDSLSETRRLRHDARHHNLQIVEYVKNGETDALLNYLGDYEKEADSSLTGRICENLAANSILSVYARKAEKNGIAVHFDVVMEQDISISDVDIVAILANLMENAIHGCLSSQLQAPRIDMYIGSRSGKLIIYICNTAARCVILENGLPQAQDGIGVSSIIYSASRYGGEYDFQSADGVFICQILLKIP